MGSHKGEKMRTNKYGGKRGWFNESKRHALARKGIKTTNKRLSYIPKELNKMTYTEQKGFIKDLAKKSVLGVKHAIQWEKEHLPKQKQWVKDEFNEGKKDFQNFIKKFKKHPDEGKSKSMIDMEEVADELDHDEDGTPDIPMEELEDVNKGIKMDLESIDLDYSGVPDYKEVTVDIEPQPKTARERRQKQARELIREVGTPKEREELKKDVVEIDTTKLSDTTLKEMARRYKSGIFGGNPFRDEIERREQNELRLKKDLFEIRTKSDIELQAFKEKVRERKAELKRKAKQPSIFEEIFG